MIESFATIADQYPLIFYTLIAIGSLCIGSFLNVVIIRLPIMMENQWQDHLREIKQDKSSNNSSEGRREKSEKPFNIAIPRSHCHHCGHRLTIGENLPVISYILLRGKCSACNKHISLRYPIVELITGIVSIFIVWYFGLTLQAASALVLTWALMALSLIDYDTQLLPDSITLPLLWLGLIVNISATFTPLNSAVLGAIMGYLSLWFIFHIFKHFTGKEGLGYGDFKLLAALGAWLGWQQLAIIIFLSSFVGAIIGIVLIFMGKQAANKPIPFGPYLALAGWTSLLWGEKIIDSYLHMAGLS